MPGEIFIWIGIVSLLLLSAVLLIFIFGLLKGAQEADQSIEYQEVSILIPFRNESNILQQLRDLKALLSGTGIKVFWIDDFSQNTPLDFVKAVENEPNFNLIKRPGGKPGKKEAIVFGMNHINTEWVLLMDADTKPQPTVFSKGSLPVDSRWKMVLLPLFPISSRKPIRIFYDLEFLVLQLVTHASAILGYPLLANGAALLVKRADYLQSLKIRKDFHIASGDDIFALFAFQSKFGRKSIGSAAYRLAPFEVTFPSSHQDLWEQRLRWVSKTGQVQNTLYLFVSVLVVFANISFLCLAAYFLYSPERVLVGWALLAYLVSSVFFLFMAVRFGNRWRLTPYIIPAIFVYPFYLSALLLTAAIVKPKWK